MLAPWMISPLPGSHSLGRVLIRQGGWKHSATSCFAIAITLIILEIAVPAGSAEDLVAALPALWPSYLAYLVSFATIGAIWFGHTVITNCLDHADLVFIRLNLRSARIGRQHQVLDAVRPAESEGL